VPGQRKAGKLNGYLRLNAKINGERQKKTKHPRERRQALVLACLYCNVYVSKLKNASRKKNSRRKTPSKGVGSKSGCKDRELFLISKIFGDFYLKFLTNPCFEFDSQRLSLLGHPSLIVATTNRALFRRKGYKDTSFSRFNPNI
jgi:hypothetical protein